MPQILRLVVRAAHSVRQAACGMCIDLRHACLCAAVCVGFGAWSARSRGQESSFRRKHSATLQNAPAAASATMFCRLPLTQDPSISQSAVSFISQRSWATLTPAYPRKKARTACWPPNSAAAPDRAPLLGPAAEPPRAYWLACVREQCTLWRPAG